MKKQNGKIIELTCEPDSVNTEKLRAGVLAEELPPISTASLSMCCKVDLMWFKYKCEYNWNINL